MKTVEKVVNPVKRTGEESPGKICSRLESPLSSVA